MTWFWTHQVSKCRIPSYKQLWVGISKQGIPGRGHVCCHSEGSSYCNQKILQLSYSYNNIGNNLTPLYCLVSLKTAIFFYLYEMIKVNSYRCITVCVKCWFTCDLSTYYKPCFLGCSKWNICSIDLLSKCTRVEYLLQ